jgi:AcrR family transcriptional regulator
VATGRDGGLRERTRDAVRAQLAETAIGLFAEHGFDQVTVEQIAAEAGISARSFHRYFPAKEDAVIGDATQWGEVVATAVASRPEGEEPWDSLREAYLDLVAQPADVESGRRTMRVLMSTASLRARNLEKHLAWAEALIPIVEARLAGRNQDAQAHLRAQTLVHSSLACFDVAMTTWAHAEDDIPATVHVNAAFATLRPA